MFPSRLTRQSFQSVVSGIAQDRNYIQSNVISKTLRRILSCPRVTQCQLCPPLLIRWPSHKVLSMSLPKTRFNASECCQLLSSTLGSSRPQFSAPTFSHTLSFCPLVRSNLWLTQGTCSLPNAVPSVSLTSRQLTTKPPPKARAYVDKAKTRMKVWAQRRMKSGRLFWARRAQMSRQFWFRQMKAVNGNDGHRINSVRESLRSRQEELQKLKGRIKERSKRIKEQSKKAGRSAMTFFQKYGAVGFTVYLIIYVLSVAGFFVAASSGWLTADHVKHWVSTLHLENHVNASALDRVDTFSGRLLLAWLAAKVIEPLRLFLAVSFTPSLAKFLRNRSLWVIKK